MSEPRPADAAPLPDNAASQADLQALVQDRERVQAWLDARATGARAVGASTLSQYRVEAERVCWYARTFGKPIASWLRDDAVAYLRFLQEPPTWAISARGIERDAVDWTPLRGPLSARSTRQSSVIAANLCGWLQRTGYLRTNPFLDDDAIVITVPAPSTASSALSSPPAMAAESDASLSAADMALLVDAVRARVALGREARLRQARDRFLAELLAHAGLRVSELVSARMGDVTLHAVPAAQAASDGALPASVWLLTVGSGRAQRWLPCDALMVTLREYRAAFGLSPLPLPDEPTPLLLSIRKRSPRRADGSIIDSPALRRDFGERKGIASRSQLLQIVKAMLDEAADYARAAGQIDAAARLANASLRGVRGAHLRERLAAGEAAADVAHALGLAALPTAAARAREANLAASIAEAARKLAAPSA
ncbi:integrase [Ralstonia sp. A12]|uniref:integrase n=1 Tax=Ralstonia sp. A12 TaxID=1217052 RepID=UPI000574042D|nr:integrase [Ralstonia sp. A12]KHK57737.1 integrase [Ralstonia sp. A12]